MRHSVVVAAALAACLLAVAPARAQNPSPTNISGSIIGTSADPMDGRLGLAANQPGCGSAPCGWINADTFSQPIFEYGTGMSGNVDPVYLTLHYSSLPKVWIPDNTLDGEWRQNEVDSGLNPDWAAVFINDTGDGPDYCELWGVHPNETTGAVEAWHGGCMDDYGRGSPLQAFPGTDGVQASNLPTVGTMITVAEWQAWQASGEVPQHPAGFLAPYSCSTWRAPANRTDNASLSRDWETHGDCIELGTKYFLPEDWEPPTDCSVHPPTYAEFGCIQSSFVRLLIAMAKDPDAGLIAVDQSGGDLVTFRIENPARTWGPWAPHWYSVDPYDFHTYGAEDWNTLLLREFPFDETTVVPPGA